MASYFNEMAHKEGSIVWELGELLGNFCENWCKHYQVLKEIETKQTIAEEAGDDALAYKLDEKWYTFHEKHCNKCPAHAIMLGENGK